jgi:ACS family allantoate permease-like MFS transporter
MYPSCQHDVSAHFFSRSNFSSIILKNVGYTSRQTLLIGLPEGVIASVFTLTCAYLSDKYRERMLPVLLALIPTITGASILVGFGNDPSHHKGALVFAIYIAQTFGSSLTIVYAWNASNVAGSSKKTAAYAAMMFSFALGNICGTYIFQAKE